ncbi:MAG: 1-acyl-sn-glycerol-3-phosphate acyltransferase [Bacilli bacterium]|nr:1-acyl-sn-glycerol-3-phosphate acyltransferase [Bacilli bacterium]
MKYKVELQYDYPKDEHQHMIDPPQTHKNDLDKNYAYYNTTKWYKFKRVLWQIFTWTLARLVIFIRYKPHYYGRENLKKYKDVLNKGFVSVCNHTFEWDFMVLRLAIQFRKGFVMLWHNNHNRKIGHYIHDYGSVPIPKDDFGASLKFFRDIKKLLDDGNWLHVYAEEAMFFYYQGLREFKEGAFYIACHNDKPILPLSISFRPSRGLWRLWNGKVPCVNCTIGEPLFPNKNLEMKDRIQDLLKRSWEQVNKQFWDYTPDIKENS